jgi:hypothetical protein
VVVGADFGTKTANYVFAGATSGGAANPDFRALVAADIPDISATYQPKDAALTALAGGSDFVAFSGPGTSTKTFTLPDKTGALEVIVACSDAGANDTYTCAPAPDPVAYVTGEHYRFKANTINTGAATINFHAIGAAGIVKRAGGITTALADGDIRAGQWINLIYDGSNMQCLDCNGNEITALSNVATATNIANNTGTTTTVLHGNASGAPAFGAIVSGDITDGTVAPADLSTNANTRSVVFNLAAPVAADDAIYTILNPVSAVKLTRLSCGVTGTTSVVVNLEASGASLISDETVTAGDVNHHTVTTWANGSSQCGGTSSCAVAAHTPVTLHVGAISGTPTNLACSIEYTTD